MSSKLELVKLYKTTECLKSLKLHRYVCVCVYTMVCCCLVIKLCGLFCDLMVCSSQPPLSVEFSRQEYWSGLPFPFAGDLPDPGIKPMSPALTSKFFTT